MAFLACGVASIRFSNSSNPIPPLSLGSSLGEFCCGFGFDGFPDFVARKLGLVGEPLPFDALEHGGREVAPFV